MSTIIAVDPKAQIVQVFDLNGREIDSHRVSKPEGVDVRYNFPLGKKRVDIVAFLQCRAGDKLIVMQVDPQTRKLARIDDGKGLTGKALGGCLYHDVEEDRFYYIAACESGYLKWFELKDNGNGRVSVTRIGERQYVYTACQGIAADDDYGRIYFSERTYGLWSVSADPLSKQERKLIHKAGTKGLECDVEGVAIYPLKGGDGYIVVASESNNRFVLFDRREQTHVGSFLLRGVTRPEGLDIVNCSAGRYFPTGMLVCTTKRDDGRKKIVVTPWDSIARSFKEKLNAGASWNPRVIANRMTPASSKENRVVRRPGKE